MRASALGASYSAMQIDLGLRYGVNRTGNRRYFLSAVRLRHCGRCPGARLFVVSASVNRFFQRRHAGVKDDLPHGRAFIKRPLSQFPVDFIWNAPQIHIRGPDSRPVLGSPLPHLFNVYLDMLDELDSWGTYEFNCRIFGT